MKKLVFVFMFLVMTNNVAFAETKSDGASEVPKEVVVKVPGAGEDEVVNLPYIVQRTHYFDPAPGNLALRGGISTAVGFPGRSYPALTGGLIGQIGLADSPWGLQATFHAGSCKKGRWKDLALDSGLAATRSLGKHVRAGIGADLMYCANVASHPQEDAGERIIGGSLLVDIEITNHLVVGVSVGLGAATIPTPGNRDTQATFYGGLSISHLWGRR